MNYAFLHRGGNSELLLLFLGWSMDEHAVAHLASGGLDVLALWDYTAPDIAFLSETVGYLSLIHISEPTRP